MSSNSSLPTCRYWRYAGTLTIEKKGKMWQIHNTKYREAPTPPPPPPVTTSQRGSRLKNTQTQKKVATHNGGEASCALGNAKHSPRSEPPIMSPAGSNAPGLIGMPSIGDIGERHGLTGAHRLTWGDRYERLPSKNVTRK